MLRNHFKIAIRQLWNNKLFSALNIFGLATSMSVCLLLIMILVDQYGYDTFHEKGDQIYRVITAKSPNQVPKKPQIATTALTIAEELKEKYPFVKGAVRFLNVTPEVRVKEKKIMEGVVSYFVDQDFLKMFSFGWTAGDQRTALLEPRSVVLSESTAERFFPYSDPLHQTIELKDLGTFTVTGILPDPPMRSHIQFGYLISYSTINTFTDKEREVAYVQDEYFQVWRGFVYLLLEKHTPQSKLDEALATVAANYSIKDGKEQYLLKSQVLANMYPGEDLGNEMGLGSPPSVIIYFLIVLGLIIIFSACFNYTNLSIAKALKRTKEIGVRKVMGASRRDVILQIIGEAIIFSMVSLLLAIGLLEFLLPAFLGLDPFIEQVVHLEKTLQVYLLFLGFSIVVGAIAGLLPALNIAKLQPVQAIQKLSNIKLFGRGGIQKVLITIQFAFSLLFILTVLIVLQQQQHVLNTDIGMNFQNMYNVRMQEEDYEKFAQKVRQIKGIKEVSTSSAVLLTGERGGGMIGYNEGKDSLKIECIEISANYVDNFEIDLIAGSNLPGIPSTQNEQFVLVNELATQKMGFPTPELAIGQSIRFDTINLSIVGVTGNFHQSDIWFDPITPFLLRQNINNKRVANIRISEANNTPETIAAIHSVWKVLATEKNIDGFFVTDRVMHLTKFFKIGSKMIGFVGFLSILIACMGLLGIVIYTTETKMKEVGIRKILGASRKNIIWRLSKGFFMLLGIAILIATPLTIIGANMWIQNFAYQMTITPMLVLSGIAILLILGLITVISQTYLAASSNPVESLRSE